MIDQKKEQGTKSGGQFHFDAQHGYPVDNYTYNLMSAFVSKCESIDAYRKYAKDNNGQFFQQQIQQEWDEAKKFFDQLKQHICQ